MGNVIKTPFLGSSNRKPGVIHPQVPDKLARMRPLIWLTCNYPGADDTAINVVDGSVVTYTNDATYEGQNPHVRDTGEIVVGAKSSADQATRLDLSNYGLDPSQPLTILLSDYQHHAQAFSDIQVVCNIGGNSGNDRALIYLDRPSPNRRRPAIWMNGTLYLATGMAQWTVPQYSINNQVGFSYDGSGNWLLFVHYATAARVQSIGTVAATAPSSWSMDRLTLFSLPSSTSYASDDSVSDIKILTYAMDEGELRSWATNPHGYWEEPTLFQIPFAVPAAAGGDPVIAPANLSQAQSIGAIAITQHHVLTVADLEQAQTVEGASITQHHVLALVNLLQAQTIDGTDITQHHALVLNDVQQSQTLDNVTLTVAGVVAPADLDQAQTIDATEIIQHHVLAVAELAQAQTLDNVTVSDGGTVLVVQSLAQVQLLDIADIVQHNVLVVDSLTQQQIIDGVTFVGAAGWLEGVAVIVSAMGGTVIITPALDGEITIN